MSLRRSLVTALGRDAEAFRADAATLAARHDLAETRRRLTETAPADFEGPPGVDGYDDLSQFTRRLVWRAWLFDTAPLGLTVAGPAYEDTPLVYATERFRELTGYSMAELRGENPRLLQGPETEADAVDRLREAVSIWSQVTVELRNYRRDGTAFRNRVTLVPMSGPDGPIRNWVGIQEVVDPSGERASADTEGRK